MRYFKWVIKESDGRIVTHYGVAMRHTENAKEYDVISRCSDSKYDDNLLFLVNFIFN